ncbi:tetratricopeptide repeat protein [Aeromonas jandaei]|uniref:tetratricopeptide repeat protein n=1 Tax=Aeromonas jandaei TaxID=650 RepID=UPI0038CF7B06
MLKVKQFSILVLNSLFAVSFANAAADKVATADELYQQAVIPYEQGWDKGLDLMWQAANAGSTKALCTIASGYQGTSLIVNADAQKYFKKAAELGGFCGMLALSNIGENVMLDSTLAEHQSDGGWSDKLIKKSKQLAEEGDIGGLKTYSFILSLKNDDNGACKWLEKAAQKGDAGAQFNLANDIRSGCGWYLIPGSRDKAVRHWIEQAANNGNPRAMDQLAVYYQEAGDIKSMLHWYGMGANIGNVNSILFYSGYLMSALELGVEVPLELQDKVKSYGLLNAVVSQITEDDNVFSAYHQAIERMRFLEKELTTKELDEAKKWSNEWMKTHQVRNYSLEFN